VQTKRNQQYAIVKITVTHVWKKRERSYYFIKRSDSKRMMLETRSATYKMMKEEANDERQVGIIQINF